MPEAKMKARDAISGSLARCYVTVENIRYHMLDMIDFEAKYTPKIVEVPILGQVSKGHKPAGASGTFTGTIHYNTSTFRKIMYQYKINGYMPYFDIQVTNEDPTSTIGSQTTILKDCLLDEQIVAKFDTNADYLSETISGTFDDWELPTEFDLLEGVTN